MMPARLRGIVTNNFPRCGHSLFLQHVHAFFIDGGHVTLVFELDLVEYPGNGLAKGKDKDHDDDQ